MSLGICFNKLHLLKVGTFACYSVKICVIYSSYCVLSVDVVDHLLGLFLAVFRCLRVQMGVAAAEKLLHLFINLFTR